MKLYSIYRAISMDLIFYYAIEFLFLTQVKNISAPEVVLKSSFYALFMIILQIPANILIDKMGIIIENSTPNKPYTFDTFLILQFIDEVSQEIVKLLTN